MNAVEVARQALTDRYPDGDPMEHLSVVQLVVRAYLEARADNDRVAPLAPIIAARTLLADFGDTP